MSSRTMLAAVAIRATGGRRSNTARLNIAAGIAVLSLLLLAGCARSGFGQPLHAEVQWGASSVECADSGGEAEAGDAGAKGTRDAKSAGDAEAEGMRGAGAAVSCRNVVVPPEAKFGGSLILIDKEHPVRAGGAASDIVKLADEPELLQGYGMMARDIRLSRGAAIAFVALTAAAREEGVKHFLLTSGYRDADEQRRLYEQMGEEHALPPGHSEHHLGLSLDIGSTKSAMKDAPEGEWLRRNGWMFGFILRYPGDKTDITGIRYEPWHFRYVGLPHSAVMHAERLVLEQYLEMLKEQKAVVVNALGKRYDIRYYPIGSEPVTIRVPANRPYNISGNNADGVIVTY